MIEFSLLLLLVVALVGAVAERVPLPLPILLILAGVGLSFVPALGELRLDPEIFFALFIPPLLFAEAWQFPKRELKRYRYSILLLALGLVAATTVVVGYVVHWMIPSIPLAAAFALGAVISPTDTVATAEITRKLKLPLRLTSILNGESLINDASGLVAFKIAVAAVAAGAFSLGDVALSFVWVAGGGVLLGLATAWLIQRARQKLVQSGMSATSIQIALSLLTPFAAHLVAEHAGASAILAAVAAGLYAGIDDLRTLRLETRLNAWSVWEMLIWVLNGVVFLLLGLQLKGVIERIEGHSNAELMLYAAAVTAVVIVLRLAWMYPGARVAWWLTRRHVPDLPPPPPRNVFIAGWAGVRGAVTLAAAFSLPLTAGTTPFPERDLLIFLAASVIVLTLLVNGLSLPVLIRRLRIEDDGVLEAEERAARAELARAAIALLRARLEGLDDAHHHQTALRLIREHESTLGADAENADDPGVRWRQRARVEDELRRHALAAQRRTLHALRDTERINELTLFRLERELDLRESDLALRQPAGAD